LRGPNGVAVDDQGAVYVSANGDGRVFALKAGAQEPTSLALEGLDQPWGIAVGPDRSVYVADSGNGRVLKLRTN
jgi:DNA-binding beta-propeller fold protein YncE